MKMKANIKHSNFQWTRKPTFNLVQVAKQLQMLFFPPRTGLNNYLSVKQK